MNRPLLAVAALTKKSVPAKIQLGEAAVAGLTNNPTVFERPSPTIAVLTAATTELHDANEDAATGSHKGKQRLVLAEEAFAAAIGEYQTYVNLIAKGNGVVIEQSGLQVSRSAQRSGPLPAPTDLRLGGTTRGQLAVSVDSVPTAKSYVWLGYVGITAPTAATAWLYLTITTVPRAIIAGLASGSTQWICCVAAGTKGPSPLSEPVSRLVL